MMILASAAGSPAPAIARLVAADEDTVRDVIHNFDDGGLATLDPHWAGGRPRRISAADEDHIVTTAKTRPKKLGRPSTHWSTRKLADYLATNPVHPVHIGRERLRQLLRHHHISFQKTRTWKESHDPDYDATLGRIEEVTTLHPDRCYAFDQFGPLSIRPGHGQAWAEEKRPHRLPANYHRTHGTRQFHGCYSLGEDKLWGIMRRRKGADHTLAALTSIRAAQPDGGQIYIILDNLAANKTPKIRRWAASNNVELCLTPTQASWSNPIEAQFGPLRTFVIDDSNYANHTALTRATHAYLRWRNTNARHPDVLATPTCSPPSAANAPEPAANAGNAGADPATRRQHDHIR
nr:IS630 family transposase [Frankia sp. CiP3]